MAYEVNGKTVDCTADGYLESVNDWDLDVAQAIADDEELPMTDKHWDVVNTSAAFPRLWARSGAARSAARKCMKCFLACQVSRVARLQVCQRARVRAVIDIVCRYPAKAATGCLFYVHG